MTSPPPLPYQSPKATQRISLRAKILLLLAWITLFAPPYLANNIYGENLKFKMIDWANDLAPLLSWPVASKVVVLGPWLAIASISLPMALVARRATLHLSTSAARIFRFLAWALVILVLILVSLFFFVVFL